MERFNFNGSFQYIDKLQILVPVHHLKAGIPRIALVVHNFKNQIGKRRTGIQIDGMEEFVLCLSHDRSPVFESILIKFSDILLFFSPKL